ncbi:restriction endonuclease [Roseibium polysiphoniae]|uniref:Restriction endonuclease n=1 Tax=Roseibium polysiphoniae TaxID=2571221 RepID=A0ABR9CD09_9HYPH|nr:restriction endonuclease [Roseibium polysiphoniae]MBD8877764.1 restriction endonuclease [Roseibium polysiphoniae]
MSRRFTVEPTGMPDLPGMMLATIEALKQIGGSASIQELEEKVIEIEGLSEEEQSYTQPGDDPRTRVAYFLAWARTYLKRGGALENSSRGVWALTDDGEAIVSKQQTEAIHKRVLDEERERAKAKRKEKLQKEAARKDKRETVSEPAPLDADEDTTGAENWKLKLRDTLRAMDPSAFERLSQRLLREAGFIKVEVRGKTGDGGIDGVGVLRVNLVSFQVYFQCKRWKGSVGSKEIRDFRGALQGRADKGLFITTGTFTSQASEEATRDGAIAIDLIDGDRLCDLLKQYDLGVKTQMIEAVTIDAGWFQSI